MQYFLIGKKGIFRRHVSMWSVGVECRKEWAIRMMSDPKEGITAIQGLRNGSLGATILGTAAAQLASRTLAIMTNPEQLQQVAMFGNDDPITGDGKSIASPQFKLALALGTLLLSVMCLAQFVRFSLHLMFVIQVVAGNPIKYSHLLKLTRVFIKRSSMYFSLGLRFLFLFLPAIMWILGVTALLITTVIEVGIMLAMDIVPVDGSWLAEHEALRAADEAELLASTHLLPKSTPPTPGQAPAQAAGGAAATADPPAAGKAEPGEKLQPPPPLPPPPPLGAAQQQPST
ncbi:hypothetical protein APUTEX25_003654 [Auxenochlorella protothecoides]|nr:hypothetical protein APUTEX25_003654 [Auxenochlorella protothecoides]|eukprot:RMZ52511.1 hypothetical protein APUTEX25_003654 [Auxenochlorella protothecoides]